MNVGYYKRRRGLVEHLEVGKISLFDLGIHDYLCLKSNLIVGTQCSIPPGICFTSAPAIHATCPRQISERAVQRSLEHLEQIGWIKRWHVRGKRGNYAVLICRASVHDLSGKEFRVNGEATTDWRHPVLVPVGDLSPLPIIVDRNVSGDREEIVKSREKYPAAKHPSPPADDRFNSFFETAFETYRKKNGQPPTWGGKDKKLLKLFLSEHPRIVVSEWQFRFNNYLTSTETFLQKQGDGLGYFVTHFDSFRVGPIVDRTVLGDFNAKNKSTLAAPIGKYDGVTIHKFGFGK